MVASSYSWAGGHPAGWIHSLRIAHVFGKEIGVTFGEGADHRPGNRSHLTAFRPHVVTTVAILLRDSVSLHHRRIWSVRTMRGNSAEHFALAAKV